MIFETGKLSCVQRQKREAGRIWSSWPWRGPKDAYLSDSRAYAGLDRLHRGAFGLNSGVYIQYSHSLPLSSKPSTYEKMTNQDVFGSLGDVAAGKGLLYKLMNSHWKVGSEVYGI